MSFRLFIMHLPALKDRQLIFMAFVCVIMLKIKIVIRLFLQDIFSIVIEKNEGLKKMNQFELIPIYLCDEKTFGKSSCVD